MSHWLDDYVWLILSRLFVLLPAAPRVDMGNVIVPSMQMNTYLHRN